MQRIVLSITIGILLLACSSKDKKIVKSAIDPKGSYWSADSADGMEIQMRYLPPELLALKESKQKSMESEDYKPLKKEFSGQYLFKVSIKWKNNNNFLEHDLKDQNEYYDRLNYFLTMAGNDFRFIQGKDTLPPLFCQLERTYEQTPFVTLLLGFNYTKIKLNPEIIYYAGIWNRRPYHLKFNKEIF